MNRIRFQGDCATATLDRPRADAPISQRGGRPGPDECRSDGAARARPEGERVAPIRRVRKTGPMPFRAGFRIPDRGQDPPVRRPDYAEESS